MLVFFIFCIFLQVTEPLRFLVDSELLPSVRAGVRLVDSMPGE
jgi:hypothetical protein